MAVENEVKGTLIAAHKRTEGDTGSPEVQIALSTARIR
ncbi:MAG: 30S ribosomal protein S15, partial [Chloroflexi bacterium]